MTKFLLVLPALLLPADSFALQALQHCNEFASMPMVKAVDDNEVLANAASKDIQRFLSHAQANPAAKEANCRLVAQKYTEYQTAGNRAVMGIRQALPSVRQLEGPNGVCTKELENDLQIFVNNSRDLANMVNATCAGAGGPAPAEDNRPRPR